MKATLDMREDGEGLGSRDAARVEAGIREGLALLELSRALAFGPWPGGECEPAEVWRRALEPDLTAMAASYRGKVALTLKGENPWPGSLLRSFTLSLSKLLLPQALPDSLCVEAGCRDGAWVLTFHPVLAPPLALQPEGAPRDLHGIWVKTVAQRCGMVVGHSGDALTLSIPRHPEGLPPVE